MMLWELVTEAPPEVLFAGMVLATERVTEWLVAPFFEQIPALGERKWLQAYGAGLIGIGLAWAFGVNLFVGIPVAVGVTMTGLFAAMGANPFHDAVSLLARNGSE
jgi:hypothetical protein